MKYAGIDGREYTEREVAAMAPDVYAATFAGARYVQQAAFAPGGLMAPEPYEETAPVLGGPPESRRVPPGQHGGIPMDPAEIARRFLYHAPNAATRELHEEVRRLTLDYAQAIVALLPGESREKSLTVTALEESSFWSHAHIARNVGREDPA